MIDESSLVYQAAGMCGDVRGDQPHGERCRQPHGHTGDHRGPTETWGASNLVVGDRVIVSTEPLRYGTVLAIHPDGSVTVEWTADEQHSQEIAERPRPKDSLPVTPPAEAAE